MLVIGQFAAYTYIARLVRDSAGLQGFALSAPLLGYGGAGLLGTVVAGRFVDRGPGPTLATCVALVAAALLALASGAAGCSPSSPSSPGRRHSPRCRSHCNPPYSGSLPHAQDAASAVQIGIGGGALFGEQFVIAVGLQQLPALRAGFALTAAAIIVSARLGFPTKADLSAVYHHA